MILIIFGNIGGLLAQDIRLTATVNHNTLTINDQLELTLTIHGTQDTAPPSFPAIDGFTLLYGPKISAQTNIINGNVSVKKGFTYVLQPAAKGKFTIGPSSVEYKGKVYTSAPLTVEVVDASASPGPQTPDFNKLIFVEMTTDKNEAYLYEQIILSFRLYFQRGLPIADIDYSAPAAKNFMEEKLGDQRQYEEIRDGVIYNVLELRTALFPMVSGKLVISPATLKCNLIFEQRRGQRDSRFDSFFGDAFIDDFFGRKQSRYPLSRATEPISLEVKPLPEQDKPKDFNGAVGTFNMEVTTKADHVKVGDPITLTISVYGEGNIQTVSEPLLVADNEDDFKLYPAESTTQITNREEVIRGRKVFGKVIEPQKKDLKSTPVVVFSFFDPRTGQYRTIEKGSVPIIVETGEQEIPIQLTVSGNVSPSGKQQVQLLTQDILPIMTSVSSLENQGNQIYKNPILAGCLAIPGVVVIVSLFIIRHKEKLQTDIGYARNKRAHAFVRKRLAAAQTALSQHIPEDFYSSLSKAMSDYFADKLNISSANSTGDTVATLLRQKGVAVEIVKEVSDCMVDFDYRRFSKKEGSLEEMEQSLRYVEQLIARLEKLLL